MVAHIQQMHTQVAFALRTLDITAAQHQHMVSRDRNAHLAGLAESASRASMAGDSKTLYKVQKALRPFSMPAPPIVQDSDGK
eukprot:4552833-Alexandrium_andersonii.AAC.1